MLAMILQLRGQVVDSVEVSALPLQRLNIGENDER
jgi:hypothetical protein